MYIHGTYFFSEHCEQRCATDVDCRAFAYESNNLVCTLQFTYGQLVAPGQNSPDPQLSKRKISGTK